MIAIGSVCVRKLRPAIIVITIIIAVAEATMRRRWRSGRPPPRSNKWLLVEENSPRPEVSAKVWWVCFRERINHPLVGKWSKHFENNIFLYLYEKFCTHGNGMKFLLLYQVWYCIVFIFKSDKEVELNFKLIPPDKGSRRYFFVINSLRLRCSLKLVNVTLLIDWR